jgi:hypothetical protein
MPRPKITARRRAAVIRQFNEVHAALRYLMLGTNKINTSVTREELHAEAKRAYRIQSRMMGIGR